jgi:hypothetical protein
MYVHKVDSLENRKEIQNNYVKPLGIIKDLC